MWRAVVLLMIGACSGGSGQTIDAPIDVSIDAPDVPLLTITEDAPDQVPFALVAVQDGDGPWQVVTGTNGMYTAPIATGRYSAVMVCTRNTAAFVNLVHATLAELPIVHMFCAGDPGPTATVAVTMSNITAGETATARIGRLGAQATPASPVAMVSNVVPGTQDIVVTQRASISAPVDRMAIARDRDVAAGANTASIDLNALGFAPQSLALTVTGALDVGETASLGAAYISPHATFALLPIIGTTSYQAVPSAQLQPNDLQDVSYTGMGNNRIRTMELKVHDPLAAAISLPLHVTGQIDSVAATPFVQWRMIVTPYPNAALYTASAFSGSTFHQTWISKGWFGSATSYTLPDLTAIPGWNAAWNLAPGVSTGWALTAYTWTGSLDRIMPTNGLPAPADVGTKTLAEVEGMFTP
jgi:hypothetical protein